MVKFQFLLSLLRRPAWGALSLAGVAVPLLIAVALPVSPAGDNSDLDRQVRDLTAQVQQLRLEQNMPAVILNQHRDSICYIYGTYRFDFPPHTIHVGQFRGKFSGTGFVVADGLIATNRHVAQPWYEDDEADDLERAGAKPHLEKLIAFFPGLPFSLDLTDVVVSKDSDVAVARFDPSKAKGKLRPLPLAQEPSRPGEPVVVVGYPMGITAMVAKSPRPVYRQLAHRTDDVGIARQLAVLSLIRPSATQGHLGDVVGDKLVYDASTAHGGSGGPVFNLRGQVIGINAAYLDGFAGSTLAVAVNALRPVIQAAEVAEQATQAAQAQPAAPAAQH